MGGSPAILIIGAGFSGLGMAIQLKKAGIDDFVILEKDDDLGGTWRDNRYPGCACDVPSHLYSFSYELNPDWSRMFAPQPEIWDYLQRCADKYGLSAHFRYGAAVELMEWDEAARRWRVTTRRGDVYTAQAIVSGIGALHIPSMPDIPGADRFAGPSFHSAQWDSSYDLTGKRVAVIGTGASAIQFVPEIAGKVARLDIFQRTPPWIHPRPDFAIPGSVRKAFRTAPVLMRAVRGGIYWALEARAVGFALHPRLMAPLQGLAKQQIRRQVADPGLRAKVTPSYTIGCKRILLSSDYYPALSRPNVNLVTDPIVAVTETGVVCGHAGGAGAAPGASAAPRGDAGPGGGAAPSGGAAAGGGRGGGAGGGETTYEVDVIIYATGFKVIDSLAELNVAGRDGVKLQDVWRDGVEAYHGITIPGFPNFFQLLGPNTGLGHTSVVFMIETQVQHVMSCLRRLRREGKDTIEVRAPALRRFNDGIHRRLRREVWSQGGCNSWYLDADGVNRTLWPGFTFEYWARTRRARRRDYAVS